MTLEGKANGEFLPTVWNVSFYTKLKIAKSKLHKKFFKVPVLKSHRSLDPKYMLCFLESPTKMRLIMCCQIRNMMPSSSTFYPSKVMRKKS